MVRLFKLAIWKHILIALFAGLLCGGSYYLIDLHQAKNMWKAECARYASWEGSEKQKECARLWAPIEEQIKEANCYRFVRQSRDTYEDIFLAIQQEEKCSDHVKAENPELLSAAQKAGCVTEGKMDKVDYYDPGPWDWKKHFYRNDDPIEIFSLVAVLTIVLLIIGKLWFLETNPGWRRLAIVLSPLIGILAPILFYFCEEVFYIDTPIPFPWSSLIFAVISLPAILLARRVIEWVRAGFVGVHELPLNPMVGPSSNPQDTSQAKKSLNKPAIQSRFCILDISTPAPGGTASPVPSTSIASFWDRAYARGLDFIPVSILTAAFAMLLPSPSEIIGGAEGIFLERVVFMLLCCLLLVAYDTWFLSGWGTTPGKALLGIRVSNDQGGKLPRNEAFLRAIKVVTSGMWLTVFFPALQIGTGLYFIRKKSTPWDLIGDAKVYQKRIGLVRRVLLASVAIIFLTVFGLVQNSLRETTQSEIHQIMNY